MQDLRNSVLLATKLTMPSSLSKPKVDCATSSYKGGSSDLVALARSQHL